MSEASTIPSAASPAATLRAWVDPWVACAVVVGLVLRWAPLWLWGFGATVRDEAQYRNLARMILAGEGLGAPQDWLWAPAYPYLIAFFKILAPVRATESLPYAQGVLGALTCVTMFLIARRVFGGEAGLRAGRAAAVLYALHPTLIFFSGRLWCESVYGPVLLLAILSTLWARDGGWKRMIVPGVLIGLCVLLRGVATYLPPFFVLAALWPAEGLTGLQAWKSSVRARSRSALALVLATTLTVAPYSIHASRTYGGLIVSDATVGNLMYLGNNDFQPITFDYGNGLFKTSARGKFVRNGRKACPGSNPVVWNRCEVRRGMDWIKENPGEFVARVPMRVAQLLTPHTFLTRALRWGKYQGVTWWMKEGVIGLVVLSSFAVMVGGTIGAVGRSRGPYAIIAWGILFYTIAASAALYGLSRFRVPLEPLWMLFLADLLVNPRVVLGAYRASPVRIGIAAVLVPLVLLHVLWYLPAGYPGFSW